MFSVLGPIVLLAAAAPPADDAFFESRIRPVLAGVCARCHGPQKASGRLRLDSREALMKGGNSGPAVVPGKPADSLLLRAVRRLDKVEAMPPDKPLPAQAVKDLERWVAAGASWPARTQPIEAARHWAFEAVRAARPPAVPGASLRNPIDAFLTVKQQAKGLTPAGPADRQTLIRRIAFDLTGLPPTPEEVEAFLTDESPQAFEKLVDRLLASPRYGEKWGRLWLDVVRYADTAGETADYPVPNAWRYRNYVIGSFNADTPYSQFIREQIAGDLLDAELPATAPHDRHASLVTATGYLAISRRFGFDIAQDHALTIEDTIDTVGKSVLGLTIACARCHDHKYDPISSADYYALYGIFDSTRYPFPGCEKDKVPRNSVPLVPAAEHQRRLAPLQAGLAAAEKKWADTLERARPVVAGAMAAVALSSDAGLAWIGTHGLGVARELAAAREVLREHDAARRKLEEFTRSTPTAYAVAEGKPHNARAHRRGDPEVLGDEVARRFPQVLGGQFVPPGTGSGRLQLAGWLTDPANPLTARVMVNRIWQGHFGAGLVRTPNDFGTRGEAPTHPELLDWLAARFVSDGWSIKRLHRLILLSDVYQRSAAADGRCVAIDPDNRYLARFERRRLTAEEIRDSLLAVSGDLDSSPGGSHPFPEPSTWQFTQHNPFAAVYEHNRRSVYLMTQRIKRHPFLALFDGPDPNASTGHRHTTTVPTQALFFLNDPFVHARANSLAGRLLQLSDDATRLDRACRLLYGRPPRPNEKSAADRFLAGDSAGASTAWAAWLRVMLASNEFIYVD